MTLLNWQPGNLGFSFFIFFFDLSPFFLCFFTVRAKPCLRFTSYCGKLDRFYTCCILFPRLCTKRTWSGWRDAAGPLRTLWTLSKPETHRPLSTRGSTANHRAPWSSPASSTSQPSSCPSRTPTTSVMWVTAFRECDNEHFWSKSGTLLYKWCHSRVVLICVLFVLTEKVQGSLGNREDQHSHPEWHSHVRTVQGQLCQHQQCEFISVCLFIVKTLLWILVMCCSFQSVHVNCNWQVLRKSLAFIPMLCHPCRNSTQSHGMTRRPKAITSRRMLFLCWRPELPETSSVM